MVSQSLTKENPIYATWMTATRKKKISVRRKNESDWSRIEASRREDGFLGSQWKAVITGLSSCCGSCLDSREICHTHLHSSVQTQVEILPDCVTFPSYCGEKHPTARKRRRRTEEGGRSFNLVSEGSIKPRSIPGGGAEWTAWTSHHSFPSQHLKLGWWRVIAARILKPQRCLTCPLCSQHKGKINGEKEATAASRPKVLPDLNSWPCRRPSKLWKLWVRPKCRYPLPEKKNNYICLDSLLWQPPCFLLTLAQS